MDSLDYLNNIMSYILQDEIFFEKLVESSKQSNIFVEVSHPSDENSQIKVTMMKKQKLSEFLKKELPKYKKIKDIDTKEDCAICFETYQPNTFKRTLSCNHHFHKKCIDKWFKKCNEQNIHCPICRQSYQLKLDTIHNFEIHLDKKMESI